MLALVAVLVGVTAVDISSAGRQARASSINQVVSWGYGASGQLGDGGNVSSNVPVNVTTTGALDGKTVTKISAGNETVCALDAQGDAYCWGDNQFGQLGNGTATSSNVPVAVSMPQGVTFAEISVGQGHVCALTPAGLGYCWGYGGHGELGNGSIPPSPYYLTAPTATLMPSGKVYRSISAGNRYTCAVTTDNQAFCWGTNGNGQLGTNDTTSANSAVAVLGALSFSAIEAALNSTCGLTTTNVAYCWGFAGNGRLGNNTSSGDQLSPGAVDTTGSLPDEYVNLASNVLSDFFCGRTQSGEVWCWGDNANGQLGNGTTSRSLVPTQTIPVSGRTFSSVSVGAGFACAITDASSVYCWGANNLGQLGDNTVNDSTVATAVSTAGVLTVSSVNQIALGNFSTVALATTVPGAPTSVVATAGVESALVNWVGPQSNGGSAVTGYTVTSNPGSRTCTSASTSCTVTGLTAGVGYTFTVIATNSQGNGASSIASNTVVPTSSNSGGGGGGTPDPAPVPTPKPTPTPVPIPTPAPDTPSTPSNSASSASAVAAALISGDVRSVTPAQIRSVPPRVFAAMNRTQIAQLTPAQVRVLSVRQLRAIRPSAFAGMSVRSVKALTVRQLQALTPRQRNALTEKQLAALTPRQRAALSGTSR